MTHSDKTLLEKFDQIINENLENSAFSTDKVCLDLGLSRSQLHRIVKEKTALSVTLYIRKRRIDKAKVLLSTTQMRMSEIADAVGIDSPQNFSKYFTEAFNLSPSDFRKQIPVEETLSDFIPENFSIAVLPFVNMSNDMEQEYFSDGITEEIINVLAQVPALKVAGRTSSFAFKNKNKDLRHIGSVLNVNHILEGSVRKSGNKLRITAQLIKVQDGFHLWSEKYDREMEDIFDIQDEISLKILAEVKIKLFGEEKEALLKRDTKNTKAYHLYLQGRFCYNKASGTAIFYKAIEYYEAAIAIEPDFVAAYVGLAESYGYLWSFSQVAPELSVEKSKSYIQKAFELDPENAENLVMDARTKLWYEWDLPSAEKIFKKALAINPNSIEALLHYGMFCNLAGKYDLAIEHFSRAIALDPLSMINQHGLSFSYWCNDELEKGVELAEKMIDFKPYYWGGYYTKGLNLFEMRQFQEAIPFLEKASNLYPSSITKGLLGIGYAFTGQTKKAHELITELELNLNQHPVSNYDLGQLYIALGDFDKAETYWKKAFEMHEARMLYLNIVYRNAKFFKVHPRFQHFFKAIEEVLGHE
jgi:adenylate cyclase